MGCHASMGSVLNNNSSLLRKKFEHKSTKKFVNLIKHPIIN